MKSLVQKAIKLKLSEKKYWHKLLHYPDDLLTRGSMIDAPDFFLSQNGRHDPQAELLATLKGFFSVPENDGDSHPVCRYPARLQWLIEQLDMDTYQLPAMPCTSYQNQLKKTAPQKITMVFSSENLTSLGGMYGHTFLRLDNGYKTCLSSYTFSFDIDTGDDHFIKYSLKGIAGFYPGYFTLKPYYDRVKQYNHIDHRDMWEYTLNFTEQETLRLFKHTWELKNAYSDYYFFGENCSYVLLWLMEIARPGLNMLEKVNAPVIPTDAIRVIQKADIVEKRVFRPSLKRRTLSHIKEMGTTSKDLFDQLINDEISIDHILTAPVSPKDKAIILEIKAQQLKLEFNTTKNSSVQNRFMTALKARNSIDITLDPQPVKPPPAPEESHDPRRFALGMGVRDKDEFILFRYRAAYHGFMDFNENYAAGTQVEFGAMEFRYYFDNQRFEPEYMRLFDIRYYLPWEEFYRPLSWQMTIGLKQHYLKNDRAIAGNFATAGGATFNIPFLGAISLMAESEIKLHPELRYMADVNLGAGAYVFKEIDNWKLGAEFRKGKTITGHDFENSGVSVNKRISKKQTLTGHFKTDKFNHASEDEYGIYWSIFF